MKRCLFLLLSVVLASCGSFDKMKYRHVKKVPAIPQDFIVAERNSRTTENREFTSTPSIEKIQVDSVVTPGFEEEKKAVSMVVSSGEMESDAVKLTGTTAQIHIVQSDPGPIKRDWSLLIGAILIGFGMIALAMCIGVFPYLGLNIFWIILFEAMGLYVAWRMIGTGVTFFVTRFRRRRNYSEK